MGISQPPWKDQSQEEQPENMSGFNDFVSQVAGSTTWTPPADRMGNQPAAAPVPCEQSPEQPRQQPPWKAPEEPNNNGFSQPWEQPKTQQPAPSLAQPPWKQQPSAGLNDFMNEVAGSTTWNPPQSKGHPLTAAVNSPPKPNPRPANTFSPMSPMNNNQSATKFAPGNWKPQPPPTKVPQQTTFPGIPQETTNSQGFNDFLNEVQGSTNFQNPMQQQQGGWHPTGAVSAIETNLQASKPQWPPVQESQAQVVDSFSPQTQKKEKKQRPKKEMEDLSYTPQAEKERKIAAVKSANILNVMKAGTGEISEKERALAEEEERKK